MKQDGEDIDIADVDEVCLEILRVRIRFQLGGDVTLEDLKSFQEKAIFPEINAQYKRIDERWSLRDRLSDTELPEEERSRLELRLKKINNAIERVKSEIDQFDAMYQKAKAHEEGFIEGEDSVYARIKLGRERDNARNASRAKEMGSSPGALRSDRAHERNLTIFEIYKEMGTNKRTVMGAARTYANKIHNASGGKIKSLTNGFDRWLKGAGAALLSEMLKEEKKRTKDA